MHNRGATMLKRMAKVVLPTGGVSGVVCLTMYLTNVSNAELNSLKTIDIGEKPKVTEENLQPTTPPPPPQEKQPEPESPKQESGGDADQSDSQEAASKNDSVQSESSSDKEPEEVIKLLIKEIETKQPK